MWMRHSVRVSVLALAGLVLRGANKPVIPTNDNLLDTPTEMRVQIERYTADRGSLRRAYSIAFRSRGAIALRRSTPSARPHRPAGLQFHE